MSQFNTIAGWVLAGGIVALGGSIVAGEMFPAERPETMGYHVEGVAADTSSAPAEIPLAQALNQATAAQGEAIFARCQSCHTATQGGPNGIGPNLYGVVGDSVAEGRGGFAFSDALHNVGGSWTFEALNEWLRSPSAYASGTKMSFAGLSDILDRAAVILYLNSNGSNLPLPPPPAANDNEAGGDAAPAEGDQGDATPGAAASAEGAVQNEGDAAGAVEPNAQQ